MVAGVFAVGHDDHIAAECADTDAAHLFTGVVAIMVCRKFVDQFSAGNINIKPETLIIRENKNQIAGCHIRIDGLGQTGDDKFRFGGSCVQLKIAQIAVKEDITGSGIDVKIYNMLTSQVVSIGKTSAASMFKSVIGCIMILTANGIVRKVDADSAMI